MKYKTFINTTSVFFGIIATLHLLRAISAWPATIGTIGVPLWVSWVVVIVAGYLSYQGYRLNK